MVKTVLLVSQRPSDYVEMKRCALALRQRGLDIVFLYHCLYQDNESELSLLDEMKALAASGVFRKAPVIEEGRTRRARRARTPVALPDEKVPLWKRYVLRPLARVLLPPYRMVINFLLPIIRQIYVIRTYRQRLRMYHASIKDWAPDIIILPEDVVGLVTPLVIKAGHLNGIPSLIVPYTIANQQEAFRSLSSNRDLHADRWFNRPTATFAKLWAMEQDGIKVIRLPTAHIHGLIAVGATPPDPWMMNSGFANAIAVENQAMLDYYREAGIQETKMRVVGAVYDDYLARFLINKAAELDLLRSELGITSRKALLVIGGCPDQTGSCPGFEFADMEEFAGKLADAVKDLADGYEIVVRPHPNYAALGEMLGRAGLRVTEVDTARLVALCDVYIAFGSATIRWAASCGIPTINYDVFQYDYSDFKGVDSVVTVRHYHAFRDAVRQMRPGGIALSAYIEKAKTNAPRWGTLDGRSVERILTLIDELCAVKPAPRTAA